MATQDKLDRILQTKEEIKQAIINKGVAVDDTDTFASYPEKINNITGDIKDVLKDILLNGVGTSKSKLDLSYFLHSKQATQEILDAVVDLAQEYEVDSATYFLGGRGGAGLTWKEGAFFRITSNSNNRQNCFNGCYVAGSLSVDFGSIYNGKNANSCFKDNGRLTNLTLYNSIKLSDFSSFLDGCTLLESVEGLDTSNATALNYICNGCKTLTEINFVSTSKVKSFSSCFTSCANLEKIEGLDFSSATSLNLTFNGCSKLKKLDFSTLTINCTALSNTFNACSSLEEITNLNITKVTSTVSLFSLLPALKKLTFQVTEGYTRTYNSSITFHSNCPLMNGSDESHTNLVEMFNSLPTTTATTATITLTSAAYESLTTEEIAVAESKGWTVMDEATAASIPSTLELDDDDYAEMEMMEMQEGDDVLV